VQRRLSLPGTATFFRTIVLVVTVFLITVISSRLLLILVFILIAAALSPRTFVLLFLVIAASSLPRSFVLLLFLVVFFLTTFSPRAVFPILFLVFVAAFSAFVLLGLGSNHRSNTKN
jgi:hypothetical protein